MIELKNILTPQRVHIMDLGQSKKRVIQRISTEIAKDCSELNENEIFDHLIAREKLGSTGFGLGVAMPHCRMDACNKVIGSFFKLSAPVDFDALDNQKVDMIFVLLVPSEATEEHLQTLAAIAEKFSQADFLDSVRNTQHPSEIFELLSQ
ncbi:MAG: PTS IIA-like nitrogen regulatory protein PtsN [Saccharospirillaceae bacterium]|nr:PTS IIA-like nitrogen regulatory protein PtsN [Pseudomonadales bacterium]NRB79650.1 PTS IIA-like nitrogen regulatory protein PtsN [Saccharospirillaceae bacterium]